jgi:hypothetical protein
VVAVEEEVEGEAGVWIWGEEEETLLRFTQVRRVWKLWRAR